MTYNNKKAKPSSAISVQNMASKHATRAQTAEKASYSSKPTRTSNPESNTLSDQNDMLPEPKNVLAEDYSIKMLINPNFRKNKTYNLIEKFC